MNSCGVIDSRAKNQRRAATANQMGRVGIEPTTHGFSVHCSTNTTADSTETSNPVQNHLSPDLSLNVTNHPQLADLIRAWPDLPEALRAGIIAIVKSAK
jgi:hypothetical protein